MIRSRTRGRVRGASAGDPIAALIAAYGGIYLPVWDLSGLFADQAGTSPAVIGGQVGAVRNAGTGSPLAVADGAGSQRPVLMQDSDGGFYLSSDGIDDALLISNTGVAFSAGVWTVLAVASTSSVGAGLRYLLDGGTLGARPVLRSASSIRATTLTVNPGFASQSRTAFASGLSSGAVFDVASIAGARSIRIALNNAGSSTSYDPGYSAATGTTQLAIFRQLSGGSYWAGRLYGFAAIPADLTSSQFLTCINFLRRKAKK